MRILCTVFSLFFLLISSSYANNHFPKPGIIKDQVEFWKKIYTQIDTNGGYIHDTNEPKRIYKTIHFPKNMSKRKKKKMARNAIKTIMTSLKKIAKSNRKKLSHNEKNILKLFPADISKRSLILASKRIRFQLGQADKFKLGLSRSGKWLPHILSTLKSKKLPLELAALPHVESSFNVYALSHVGASGIWQFTRSTGRRYLRIDHVVDERNDPNRASVAAAQLLQHNYSILNSWPLALTAYNHGLSGMRRAVKSLGTNDLSKIIKSYKGRTFKFASKNFYSEFLAALEVSKNAHHYFGKINYRHPERHTIVKSPAYLSVDTLAKALNLSVKRLKKDNMALRSTVWNNTKYVPKNFKLQLPDYYNKRKAKYALAGISESKRHLKQKADRYHKVRRGDSISKIAAYYRVKSRALVEINNLRSRHRIRIGQTIRLPVKNNMVKQIRLTKAPTPKAVLSKSFNDQYRVKYGDTFSEIAHQFNLSEKQLLAENNIRNKHKLMPGQFLKVAMTQTATKEIFSPEKKINALKLNTPQTMTTEIKSVIKTNIESQTLLNVSNTDNNNEIQIEAAINKKSIDPLATSPLLTADPSDYSVGRNSTIEVHELETLGHYAEWLGIRAQQLREINRIPYGKPVIVSKRIKLDFSIVTADQFETRREKYHQSIQETYFSRYKIIGTKTHTASSGDSLWVLSQQKYQLPIWLLKQFNPDFDFSKVYPGNKISIPEIKKRFDA